MWNLFGRIFKKMDDSEYLDRRSALLSDAPIPTIWLFGKTGSGKTSIIRYLTGAQHAEIGNGFRPQTKHSQLYSFPDEETPLVKFLDTRGLGEADYDESTDLQELNGSAHLLVVTVRAMDQSLEEIITPLRAIRLANPERPILLALTALHDAYPGQQHPALDPFDQSSLTELVGAENQVSLEIGNPSPAENTQLLEHAPMAKLPHDLPGNLLDSLKAQLERFSGLYDDYVTIDLTKPEEGFDQPDFGGMRMKRALLHQLPMAYQQTMVQLDSMRNALGNLHKEQCAPIILAHSVLAASVAAVPVPWIDIPAVLAIQSSLARRLALLNHQTLDATTLAQVSGVLGGRVAVQMGVRAGLKFIPWVGIAANSAATFAITYASGWAWNWYCMEKKWGHIPTAKQLKAQYQEQLRLGTELWQGSVKESQ